MLIAPSFSAGARAVFEAKQNVRLLEIPLGQGLNPFDFKRVGGGLLVQGRTPERAAGRAARGDQAPPDAQGNG